MNANDLFSEKHTAAIIDALRVAGGSMTKFELYEAVSSNPRMPAKIDRLADNDIVTLSFDTNSNGNFAQFVKLTYKGEKIAALIECIDKVLDSDGVIC